MMEEASKKPKEVSEIPVGGVVFWRASAGQFLMVTSAGNFLEKRASSVFSCRRQPKRRSEGK